jgi:hypothetical protein
MSQVGAQHVGLKPDDVTMPHSFNRGPRIKGNQNGLLTSM